MKLTLFAVVMEKARLRRGIIKLYLGMKDDMEENMITCSILMPVYNGEKYLGRAIDSIISQTYKDFEIIIIDDGSIDSSPKICDDYAEKFDCIKVFHQGNIGINKTREKLLKKATGKYIFWLDQDDYYAHTLLEKTVEAFESKYVDVVVWGRTVLGKNKNVEVDDIEKDGVEKWREGAIWGLYNGLMFYASKRELWDDLEDYPTDVEVTEDVWMTSQVVAKAKEIRALGGCFYFYDQTNVASISHSYTAKNYARAAFGLYRVLKMNQKSYPESVPPSLKDTRTALLLTYCFQQLDKSLSSHQEALVKLALKDLFEYYPQKKVKKFYFIQFCALHGINFICRWYGKSRIRKVMRYQG